MHMHKIIFAKLISSHILPAKPAAATPRPTAIRVPPCHQKKQNVQQLPHWINESYDTATWNLYSGFFSMPFGESSKPTSTKNNFITVWVRVLFFSNVSIPVSSSSCEIISTSAICVYVQNNIF